MTRAPADLTPHIAVVAAATTTATRLAAIDRAMAATVGHKLFTVLVINWDKGENQRYYSNQPDAYAIGGAKPIVRTMPGLDLLLAGKPRFLDDYAAIAACFSTMNSSAASVASPASTSPSTGTAAPSG